VLAGADVNDPTSSLEPVPDYLAGLPLRAVPRLGVDRQLLSTFDAPTQQMLQNVLEVLEGLGWTVVDLHLPDLADIAADFAPLCAVETAAAHAEDYPSRSSEYGPALGNLIDTGLAMSAVELQRLLERRRAFTGRMRRVFTSVDLLLMPGIGFASPTLEMMATLGSNTDLLSALLVPTAPFDICGMPTITLPGGFSDRGTPLAFQLAGAEFSEQLVLQAAHAYQSVTSFHRTHPSLVPSPQLERTAS
jgi:amidase